MKTKPFIFIVIATATVLLLIHFIGAQLGMVGGFIEYSYPRLIGTGSWIRCLEKDPTSHGYSIYGFLEKRETDAAIDLAILHVKSEDAYLWVNAATYLGSRGRQEAVPWLIKSIRHTASRSVDERIALLQKLTEQKFGDDSLAWKKWYLSTNPKVIPDWETSLGSSPRSEGIHP